MTESRSRITPLLTAFAVGGVKNQFHLRAMDSHDVARAMERVLDKAPETAHAFIRQLSFHTAKLSERLSTLLANWKVLTNPEAVAQLLDVSRRSPATSQDHETHWHTAFSEALELFLGDTDEVADKAFPVLGVIIEDDRLAWRNPETGGGIVLEVLHLMDAMEGTWIQSEDMTQANYEGMVQRGTRLLEHLAQRGVELRHEDLMRVCQSHDRQGTASAALHAMIYAGYPIDGLDWDQLGPDCRQTLEENARWKSHTLHQLAQTQRYPQDKTHARPSRM